MPYTHTNPPHRVHVTIHSWSHDTYGNPTAHIHLIADQGFVWNSKRREQVGYSDKVSGGALVKLGELFPRTVWKVSEDGITGDRPGGLARFDAVRDYDAEPVPVLFRAEKAGTYKGEITAVFPTLYEGDTRDGVETFRIFAHVGQHGAGVRGWYNGTRAAKPEEYAALKRELESPPYEYRLQVYKRWTPKFDEIRENERRRIKQGESANA